MIQQMLETCSLIPLHFSKSNLNIQKFFIDFCYSSVFSPRMLINFISTFLCGSMIQLYFFRFFTIPEIYVLTSMAYDCYVAICNPLFYNAAMSPKVCSSLMLASYLMAFSGAIGHTGCMFRLTSVNTPHQPLFLGYLSSAQALLHKYPP